MSDNYDVLVIGAGSSGICAALSAARLGKKTLIIEASSTLGGSNTNSLVGPLMGFHSQDTQVVRGLAQEIIDELESRKGTLGHIKDPLGVASSITPVDAKILTQVYFELCERECNLTVILQSTLIGVALDNHRISKVSIATRNGVIEVQASIYIDASGDGTLAYYSGCQYQVGRFMDNLSQPMTQIFKVSGVDFAAVRRYMEQNPDQFVLRKGALQDPYTAISGYFSIVNQARERGEFPIDRDRILLFEGVNKGEALINTSRVCGLSSLDIGQMSAAQRLGHKQVDQIISFLRKYIEGFQSIKLVDIGQSIGVRESRHIHGLFTLTEDHVMGNAIFEDAVAIGAFPIDIHDPWGRELFLDDSSPVCYDIPFSVMLVHEIDNLIVTGRCISATHVASASARITPTAMALGQAAGTAAAISKGKPKTDVDIKKLQGLLLKQGAIPGKSFLNEQHCELGQSEKTAISQEAHE